MSLDIPLYLHIPKHHVPHLHGIYIYMRGLIRRCPLKKIEVGTIVRCLLFPSNEIKEHIHRNRGLERFMVYVVVLEEGSFLIVTKKNKRAVFFFRLLSPV